MPEIFVDDFTLDEYRGELPAVAEAALNAEGVYNIVYGANEWSDTYAAGQISSQTPPATTSINRETQVVTFRVSRGPQPIFMLGGGSSLSNKLAFGF